jgi:hypothetical protein
LNRSELHERLGLWDATRADAERANALLLAAEVDPGTQIEAAHMLALADHRAGNDALARESLELAETMLIELAESTSTPSHIAEYQVRGMALRVLFGELDVESAVRAVCTHPHADPSEQTQACRLLLRWALENQPVLVEKVARELERLYELAPVEQLEVDVARALATGATPSGLYDRAEVASQRTGRYWLRELASRLPT